MPAPDWITTRDWDTLYLGGVPMPGVARVDLSDDSGLDVKKPKGARKAKVVDEGVHPWKFKVRLYLQPDELREFEQEAVPVLRPRSSDAVRDPISVSHPNAQLWGVTKVMVGDIDSPQPEAGELFVVSFTLVEWVEHTKKTKAQKKAPSDEEGDWNVQPLIDQYSPAKNGAAAANFSDPDDLSNYASLP